MNEWKNVQHEPISLAVCPVDQNFATENSFAYHKYSRETLSLELEVAQVLDKFSSPHKVGLITLSLLLKGIYTNQWKEKKKPNLRRR